MFARVVLVALIGVGVVGISGGRNPAVDTVQAAAARLRDAPARSRQSSPDPGEGRRTQRSTTLDDQAELNVTVYNSDIALVRDVRNVQIPRGTFDLSFMDIAATVNPVSVHFRSLSEPSRVGVLEQNYEYDLLEPEKLLRKYVGRDVTLVRTRQVNGTTDEEEVTVAGELNRVRESFNRMIAADAVAQPARAMAPPMAQEAFSDYHLYTLGRKTTINNNETKQVSMLAGTGFPIQKRYVVYGSQFYYHNGARPGAPIKDSVEVFYQFKNEEKGGLGMPMPAGTVRMYQSDSTGGVQFVGEDRIEHTPKDEVLDLKVGSAFDVVCERKQVGIFNRRSGD